MNFWIDAQINPALAPWLTETFGVTAHSVGALGYREATDESIWAAAKHANVCVVTKDADFLRLLERSGPPPSVLWITCGNTSNAKLRQLFERTFRQALALLEAGEALVELSDEASL
jgi:predicted nuclease of predicted toxin-antitoxin system